MRIINLLFAIFFSSTIFAHSVSNMVVFGDSLSDTGNLYEFTEYQFPTSPPYFKGRFSNGPLWIEQLMESYYPTNPELAPIENYAFAGALVGLNDDEKQFTLQQQIQRYLKDHQNMADEKSLFVLWIGGNNYLTKIGDPDETIANVNMNIVANLKRLIEKGAKNIMVINLPDLGKSPIAQEDGQSAELLSYLSTGHNNALAASMEELRLNYSNIQWIYYDVNSAFAEIRANPAKYGFENIQENCLAVKQWTECNHYFFFDSVHPTTYTHGLLGKAARVLLDNADIHFE